MQGVGRRTAHVARRLIVVRAMTWATVGLIWIAASRSTVRAQADQGWIGKRVVQKYRGFKLQGDNKGVVVRWIEFYRVERTDGERLFVKAEGSGLSGWAKINDLFPADEAMAFFDNRLRANLRDVFSLLMRAMLRRERNDLDAALLDSDKAVRLEPKHWWVYVNRGILWTDKREFDKAIADFNEAARLEPNNAVIYFDRACAVA